MRRLSLSVLPLLVGCSGAAEMTATAPSGTSTAGESTTSAASTTDAATITGDESTTAAGPSCGDGIVDPGELCDDGNVLDGDGCNGDCVPSGSALWEHREDRGASDAAYGVAIRGDQLIVGGAVTIEGQLRNGWLASMSVDGAIQWQRDYDLGASEFILAVAIAPNGEIWTAGSKRQSDHDLWVSRFNPAGEVLGGEELGSDLGDDYAGSVVIDEAGAVTVAGMFANGVGADLWVRRYDPAGGAVWTHTYDPTLSGFFPFSAKALPIGGGGVVIGFRERAGDTAPELLYALPLAGGEPLWKSAIPDTDGTIIGLAAASDGDLLISGGTFIDGDNRLIVRRLSPDGMSLKWSSIACTGRNGRGIAVDPRDQSVVVVGDGTGANADDNIRLCKHSSNGALLWGKDIDSDAGSDLGYGVAITPAGTIIAVGIIAAPGGSDAWVAAFAP